MWSGILSYSTSFSLAFYNSNSCFYSNALVFLVLVWLTEYHIETCIQYGPDIKNIVLGLWIGNSLKCFVNNHTQITYRHSRVEFSVVVSSEAFFQSSLITNTGFPFVSLRCICHKQKQAALAWRKLSERFLWRCMISVCPDGCLVYCFPTVLATLGCAPPPGRAPASTVGTRVPCLGIILDSWCHSVLGSFNCVAKGSAQVRKLLELALL